MLHFPFQHRFTSLPTCCQVKNKGYNRCGANLTDSCLDWSCADDTGLCSYFTKDCSSQIQVDDCHFAQCFSNGTGCVASVLPNAQIDICGVCNGNGVCGTTTSPNSTTTTPPTTQSNTQANVNGGQKILFNFEFVFVLIMFVAITFFWKFGKRKKISNNIS